MTLLFSVAVPLTHSTFGMGTGMIVEQVRCNGTERQIADCTVRDVPDGECNHNEDAGVRCCKSRLSLAAIVKYVIKLIIIIW